MPARVHCSLPLARPRLVAAGMLALAGLVACERPPPEMSVVATEVGAGEDVVVAFDRPHTGRATNQYWIALQRADAPASETTGRVVLERHETNVRLPAHSPGEYEVRLHGQFPRKEHHLLQRIPIVVQGWPVRVGAPPHPDGAAERCMNRWLAERDLDSYGAPSGTAYAGGNPLLDEKTGQTVTRWEHVIAQHPEVEQVCDASQLPLRGER
jgi:hypothetical protein